MHDLEEIVRDILAGARTASPPTGMTSRIIAIDGPGGAGKSSFAAKLAAAASGCQIVHTDDFASWDVPFEWWARMISDVLDPLAENRSARFRRTDWLRDGRTRWGDVAPADIVIVEGVGASRTAFLPYLTYRVWIQAPRALRLRRGLERDGEQARADWDRWMAAEDAYIEREDPAGNADTVLRGDLDLWSD